MSRVNYEVPRLSKLHEDARRHFKDFQQVWYELEMFKVCRDDMPCEVKKWVFFWVGLKKWKILSKLTRVREFFTITYMYR